MTDLTLIIGNKNYSSWSLRPWLYLKHFEIPFAEQLIYLYEEGFKEKILQYSLAGKVPILQRGEYFIWDSLSILEYLSEAYPQYMGWPKDARARAVARSVSAEMHSGFFALREYLPMNCRKVFPNYNPPEDAKNDIKRVREIWVNCRNEFGSSGPWLFGQFSIADCMYAPVVFRFLSYKPELGELETEYVNTVKDHPAMKEWMAAAKEETEIIAAAEV